LLVILGSGTAAAWGEDPRFRVASTTTEDNGRTTQVVVVADEPNTLGPSHRVTAVSSVTGEVVHDLVPTLDDAFGLTFEHAPLNEGEGLALRVTASNGSFVDDVSTLFWFEWTDGALQALTFEEQQARDFDGPHLTSPVPEPLVAPEELAHLDPRLNPALRPEDRALVERVLGPLGELGTTRAPLSVASTERSPEALEPWGCSRDQGACFVLVALPLLIIVGRRRATATCSSALALVIVAGSGSAADAKTVYGYIAFWDTRDAMSNSTGSKLPTCNSADTTCGPADGLGCCFRPIPNATVLIENAGMSPVAVEANENGFFIITGFQGNDNFSYSIKVVYDRIQDPVEMRLLTSTSGSPVTDTVFKHTLPDSTTYLPRLNVNAASDTTSTDGNIASAWTSVTDAQWGITWEGDSRFRRNFGEPSNDPDDPIYIIYSSKLGYDCTNSRLWVPGSASRGLLPPGLMGGLYQGRVVDCASGSHDIWNLADFPPNPMIEHTAADASGSESTRHHLAYRDVTMFLSRWNPGNTAIGNMKTALGYACSSDGLANSNDAAWVRNNALAIWEFIDSDTSGSDGGFSDDVDVRMKEVMDSLYGLSQWPGNPGDNASSVEAIFTPDSPPISCSDNQDCANGEACIKPAVSGATCFHGDPHGSNIYDLVVHMILLDWTYNWTGGGDFLSTLKSSACIGSVENSHPFTGGFRDD